MREKTNSSITLTAVAFIEAFIPMMYAFVAVETILRRNADRRAVSSDHGARHKKPLNSNFQLILYAKSLCIYDHVNTLFESTKNLHLR